MNQQGPSGYQHYIKGVFPMSIFNNDVIEQSCPNHLTVQAAFRNFYTCYLDVLSWGVDLVSCSAEERVWLCNEEVQGEGRRAGRISSAPGLFHQDTCSLVFR